MKKENLKIFIITPIQTAILGAGDWVQVITLRKAFVAEDMRCYIIFLVKILQVSLVPMLYKLKVLMK